MNYLEALKLIHLSVHPAFYVEIGCFQGASLALAECPRLGIDPDPHIQRELLWPTRIFRETSDAFFARPDVDAMLGQPPDLAFIDGMHLVEFALRDFMNIEAHATPEAVIVIDDVVPGDMSWATRIRETKAWTGDVYRLIPLLRHYRPDLVIEVFDASILTFDKGIAVISRLNPGSSILRDAYQEIAAKLEDGAFLEQSTMALRAQLRVRSSDELKDHLKTRVQNKTTENPEPSPVCSMYLNLLKSALVNEIYREDQYRLIYLTRCLAGEIAFDKTTFLHIKDGDPDGYKTFSENSHMGFPFERKLEHVGFAHSMMGRLRMDNLHQCLDIIREHAIPGDVMECGVWRGGGCIFMAGYLRAHGMKGRRVMVADSFEGLPTPSHEKDTHLDLSKEKHPELAIPLETVQENFKRYDLLDDQIVFLKGWFGDTLPGAPVEKLALLRLDGDLYESTTDALTSLYDKVSNGGIVIVDDFKAILACEQAVRDFFNRRAEPMPELHEIDWTGVWWVKSSSG